MPLHTTTCLLASQIVQPCGSKSRDGSIDLQLVLDYKLTTQPSQNLKKNISKSEPQNSTCSDQLVRSIQEVKRIKDSFRAIARNNTVVDSTSVHTRVQKLSLWKRRRRIKKSRSY